MKTQIDIKKYKQQRDYLRNMFEAEKTGDQTLFRDQTKLFKPVIESQKEASKAIQQKLEASQNVLVPFTRELQKRNDYMEGMQSLPYYGLPEIQPPTSTPTKSREDSLLVDVDKDLLNETHRENLQDMTLELPSVVQKKGTFEDALEKIEHQTRSIGQLLGKNSKAPEKEKEIYESRKETLHVYKAAILALRNAQQFVVKGKGLPVCRPKRGKGRPKKLKDVIVYGSPKELIAKLEELHAAKMAGNTGLDNIINSVLDELLRIKVITKSDYDQLYKSIFYGANK